MTALKRQFQAGDTVGNWLVIGKLGAGAMGIVYEVKHRVTDKPGALKVLKVVGKNADVAASKMMAEAKLLGKQNHPNLVAVHDASDNTDGDGYWMVMEKLVGRDLSDVLKEEGALSLDRTLHYAEQVAAAVSCAHAAGVVHRDLKPDNIHVSETEVLKVFDFGASRFRQGATLGGVSGTIPYMSPEQLHSGASLDGRSDVYALGLIVYEMLVGRHIYQNEDGSWKPRAQVIYTTASTDPVSAFEEIDPRVRPLLLRATAKNRDERYSSMDALAGDLHQLRKTVSRSYAPTERLTDADISAAREAHSHSRSQPHSIVRTSPMTSTQAAVVAQATAAPSRSAQPQRIRAAAVFGGAMLAVTVGVGLMLALMGNGPDGGDNAKSSASGSATASVAASTAHAPMPPSLIASGATATTATGAPTASASAAITATASAAIKPTSQPTSIPRAVSSAVPAAAPLQPPRPTVAPPPTSTNKWGGSDI